MKFYKCDHCGNIITFIEDKGVPVNCCGEEMQEIVPNSVEAAAEKHIPVFKREGQKVVVTVSSVQHPMLEEHYIAWVVLKSRQGCQLKEMHPEQAPEVRFMLEEDDEVVTVYAYCNLHGLWQLVQ